MGIHHTGIWWGGVKAGHRVYAEDLSGSCVFFTKDLCRFFKGDLSLERVFRTHLVDMFSDDIQGCCGHPGAGPLPVLDTDQIRI